MSSDRVWVGDMVLHPDHGIGVVCDVERDDDGYGLAMVGFTGTQDGMNIEVVEVDALKTGDSS